MAQDSRDRRKGKQIMSNPVIPTWLFDCGWGAGSDHYNWILYRRGLRKDGSAGTWKAVGYYPTPEQLLLSFFHKLTRTEPVDTDLADHVEALARRVTAAAARLCEELNQMPSTSLSRSPAHPNHQLAR